MYKRFTIPLLVLLAMLLQGCGNGNKDVDAEGGSPEYAATKFFYSIYDTRSMEEAIKYTTPKMTRIVKGYGSIQGVARNMLNMRFDEVEIEVDRGRNLRENYGDTATITLIFRGTYQGGKIADMRTVKMIKQKGRWLVEKVNDDPFAR